MTAFALTFAQLATCNIGLFTTAPQTTARIMATASKLCGAMGVVESQKCGGR